ncbi:MAG: integron cassette protein [endosymbiont of Escarpia spicata]|uniref:Integron cassette protein n=1 Tax=endosymbiont of Escarpia spicata TaxID=2200908 RepID=A0A370DRB1_9GAMM|nr:MAG: integron cassette protein [endosymbiont of Escarpia spicata]
MSSLAHGNSTLAVEVINISTHGVWLLAHDKELFMSYEDFPWFKEQAVKSIINVEEQSPGHFYWPDIDVDLTGEMIEHPDRFPLKAKIA